MATPQAEEEPSQIEGSGTCLSVSDMLSVTCDSAAQDSSDFALPPPPSFPAPGRPCLELDGGSSTSTSPALSSRSDEKQKKSATETCTQEAAGDKLNSESSSSSSGSKPQTGVCSRESTEKSDKAEQCRLRLLAEYEKTLAGGLGSSSEDDDDGNEASSDGEGSDTEDEEVWRQQKSLLTAFQKGQRLDADCVESRDRRAEVVCIGVGGSSAVGVTDDGVGPTEAPSGPVVRRRVRRGWEAEDRPTRSLDQSTQRKADDDTDEDDSQEETEDDDADEDEEEEDEEGEDDQQDVRQEGEDNHAGHDEDYDDQTSDDQRSDVYHSDRCRLAQLQRDSSAEPESRIDEIELHTPSAESSDASSSVTQPGRKGTTIAKIGWLSSSSSSKTQKGASCLNTTVVPATTATASLSSPPPPPPQTSSGLCLLKEAIAKASSTGKAETTGGGGGGGGGVDGPAPSPPAPPPLPLKPIAVRPIYVDPRHHAHVAFSVHYTRTKGMKTSNVALAVTGDITELGGWRFSAANAIRLTYDPDALGTMEYRSDPIPLYSVKPNSVVEYCYYVIDVADETLKSIERYGVSGYAMSDEQAKSLGKQMTKKLRKRDAVRAVEEKARASLRIGGGGSSDHEKAGGRKPARSNATTKDGRIMLRRFAVPSAPGDYVVCDNVYDQLEFAKNQVHSKLAKVVREQTTQVSGKAAAGRGKKPTTTTTATTTHSATLKNNPFDYVERNQTDPLFLDSDSD